jgi:hypothetical protein
VEGLSLQYTEIRVPNDEVHKARTKWNQQNMILFSKLLLSAVCGQIFMHWDLWRSFLHRAHSSTLSMFSHDHCPAQPKPIFRSDTHLSAAHGPALPTAQRNQ